MNDQGLLLMVPLRLTDLQCKGILRFYEICEDGQGYDVSPDQMKDLARIGLVRSTGFSRYEITLSGAAVIGQLQSGAEAME